MGGRDDPQERPLATIPAVAGVLQAVVGPVAERAARATGVVPRAAPLAGTGVMQPLVVGWLAQPTARLAQLARRAATLGVALTAPGVADRWGVVAAAVRVVLAADPVAVPVVRRFTRVAVQDGTPLGLPAALAAVWPGGGGRTPMSGAAALNPRVRLDLAGGRLQGPYLEAGRTTDRASTVADLPLPPGGLRLADLGVFSVADPAAQDAHGVYWRAGRSARRWPRRGASARRCWRHWRRTRPPRSTGRCCSVPSRGGRSDCWRRACAPRPAPQATPSVPRGCGAAAGRCC